MDNFNELCLQLPVVDILNDLVRHFGKQKVYDWLRAWMDDGDYIPAERIIDSELLNERN